MRPQPAPILTPQAVLRRMRLAPFRCASNGLHHLTIAGLALHLTERPRATTFPAPCTPNYLVSRSLWRIRLPIRLA